MVKEKKDAKKVKLKVNKKPKRKSKNRNVRFEDWIKEDKIKSIAEWSRKGYTKEQIAKDLIKIHRSTLWEWSKKSEDIANALKEGEELCIDDIQHSLRMNAKGYDEEEEVLTYEEVYEYDKNGKPVGKVRKPVVVKLKRKYKGDVKAQAIVLNNARPDKYKNRQDVVSYNHNTDVVTPDKMQEIYRKGLDNLLPSEIDYDKEDD